MGLDAGRCAIAVCVLLAAWVLPSALAGAEASRKVSKKFIELGWDIPSTAYLRENWQQMEEHAPFDGVIFRAEVEGEGAESATTQAMWDASPWKREWFEEALSDLKSCEFSKFRRNFVRVNATPGNLDWFDEDGWRVLADKMRTMGWLVRESGSAGVCVDFESYGSRQFRHDGTGGRSFGEAAAMARRRGAQFVGALAEECPSCTVLALWLNSINFAAGEVDDPAEVLAGRGYGLLPAFIDGMLDAAPATMTLVDGCESAYLYDGIEDYLRAYNRMRQFDGPAARLVSPENRGKYRAQVQVGFGFYLDAYRNPEGDNWYIGGHGGTRLGRLQHNLSLARSVTDEYVWVYGEQCRWWPTSQEGWTEGFLTETEGRGRSWEAAMPGITRAIRWARDPKALVESEVAKRKASGRLENLAANPGFEGGKTEDGLPEGYGAWQAEESSGTFSVDRTIGHGSRSSARAANVRDGCFILKQAVEPGQVYAVEADCLRTGSSTCTVMARWQSADGRWVSQDMDRAVTFRPTGESWGHAFDAVEVPEGAGHVVILLCAEHQASEEDVCWFDNVGLYRLW